MQLLCLHSGAIANKIANVSLYLRVCALTAVNRHGYPSEVCFLAWSGDAFILLFRWLVTDTDDVTCLHYWHVSSFDLEWRRIDVCEPHEGAEGEAAPEFFKNHDRLTGIPVEPLVSWWFFVVWKASC